MHKHITILLVDDEIELTQPLSRLLTREGYIVDAAYDGTSGNVYAQAGNYDLLILDWMLPGKMHSAKDIKAPCFPGKVLKQVLKKHPFGH